MTKEQLPPKCHNCSKWMRWRIDDLVQCPVCHWWFCKEHDTHECIPQPQTADLQKRIASARTRRDLGGIVFLFSLMPCGAIVLGILEGIGVDVGLNWNITGAYAVSLPLVLVALSVLSYVIWHHYEGELSKVGVHYRSIRPKTAKKDR